MALLFDPPSEAWPVLSACSCAVLVACLAVLLLCRRAAALVALVLSPARLHGSLRGLLQRSTGAQVDFRCPSLLWGVARGCVRCTDVSVARPATASCAGLCLHADTLVVSLSPGRLLRRQPCVRSVLLAGVSGVVDCSSAPAKTAGCSCSGLCEPRPSLSVAGGRLGVEVDVREARVGLAFDEKTLPLVVDRLRFRLRPGGVLRGLLLAHSLSGALAGSRVELSVQSPDFADPELSEQFPRALEIKNLRVRDVLGANSASLSALLSSVGATVDVKALLEAVPEEKGGGIRVTAQAQAQGNAGVPQSPAHRRGISLPARAVSPVLALFVRAAVSLMPAVTFQTEDLNTLGAVASKLKEATLQRRIP
eukprot:m51a1_g2134 hypothetical protein (365) ;mRNA; f:1711388-1712540